MPGPEVVLALKAVQVALDKLPVEKVFDKLPFYRPSEEDRQEASKDPAAKSTHPFPSEDQALSHGVEHIHRRHIEKIPILNKVTSGSKSKPRRDSSASDSDRSYSQNGYHQDSRAQDSPRDIRSNYDGSHGYYQNQAYGAQPHRAPSPIMGDSYYPPAGQGDYPRRYNPQDYQPRKEEGYNAYANDSYGREQYAPQQPPYREGPYRPPSTGQNQPQIDARRYSTYDNAAAPYYPPPPAPGSSYDDRDQSRDRDRNRSRNRSDKRGGDRRGRDEKKSRNKKRQDSSSRSRSRSKSGVRGMIDKRFETSERGLTTSAIGAIAGGLIANEIGKGPLATVAGVLLGGLGANAWEAREGRHREDKSKADGQRSKSKGRRSDDRGGGSRSGGGGSSRGGGGYNDNNRGAGGGNNRGNYSDDDSYNSSEEERRQQRRSRSKSGKKDKGKKEKPSKEDVENELKWNRALP